MAIQCVLQRTANTAAAAAVPNGVIVSMLCVCVINCRHLRLFRLWKVKGNKSKVA